MPPAGGFENVKYKRNLPFRGPSALVMLGGVTAICAYGFYRVGLGNLEKRYVAVVVISFLKLLFFFLLFAHSGTLGGLRSDTGFPATRESCLGNDYPNADKPFFLTQPGQNSGCQKRMELLREKR